MHSKLIACVLQKSGDILLTVKFNPEQLSYIESLIEVKQTYPMNLVHLQITIIFQTSTNVHGSYLKEKGWDSIQCTKSHVKLSM